MSIGLTVRLAAGAAIMLAAMPASAATVAFTGTRQNVNFVSPPGTGRCAPLNTVTITPTGPSSRGTSNLGNFVLTNSHCIAGPPNPANPVRDITDGEFQWDFSNGGSLFGTYAGQAVFSNGVVTGSELFTILGGTGRFLSASGQIQSVGTLGFGMVDGRAVGIFNGTLSGEVSAPGIPEPHSWAMLIAGFGLIGAVARRRRVVTA
ncbi:MAG: hypothetical protein B7Y35_05165 [Sphingomonadales bacterium 28-64-96]|nr:MAG: hypothetical protein B7Y35_05165 [Sphingomonadales bacterium 28-64-96]